MDPLDPHGVEGSSPAPIPGETQLGIWIIIGLVTCLVLGVL